MYKYGTTPNYKVEKKDHFGFSGANAAQGTGAYKQKSYTTVVGGAKGWDPSIRPEGGKQQLTLYHYYNGGMSFYVPIGDEPKFPDHYCKVAVLNCMFDGVLELTENPDGNWSKTGIVRKLFSWVHAKETKSGYRGTLVGDVVVEENGFAWRLEDNGWYFVGKFPGYAL